LIEVCFLLLLADMFPRHVEFGLELWIAGEEWRSAEVRVLVGEVKI